MAKIYNKTFVKKASECVAALDNGIGIVEEQLIQLFSLQKQLGVNDYNDIFENMDKCVSDLYSLKNDLLDKIEEVQQ